MGTISPSVFETYLKPSDRFFFTAAAPSLTALLVGDGLRLVPSPSIFLMSPLETEAVEPLAGCMSDGSTSPAISTPWEPVSVWVGNVSEVEPAAVSLPLEEGFSESSCTPAISTPWESVAVWAGDVPEGGPAAASLPLDGCLSDESPSPASSAPRDSVAA